MRPIVTNALESTGVLGAPAPAPTSTARARLRTTTVLKLLLLTALIAGFLPSRARAVDNTNSAPSPVEQFKRFISSPPIIKNLVWAQKVPMEGGQRPLDGTFALSTRFDYLQAKWQPDGLLFRRLSTPGDATNFSFAGTLVSISDHRHALVEPGGRMTTWDDRDPSVAGKKVSVFYTSHFMLEPLRRVLNLGLMYADIGSVKWEGNQFKAECDVDNEHLVITGELLPAPYGPPLALKARYAFPLKTYDYVVRYTYASPATNSALPATITSFWLPKDRKGVEIEVDQYRILDFQTVDLPLDAATLEVSPFASSNLWIGRVYTNGVFYDRMTNGTLRAAYALGDLPRPTPPPRITRTVLYVGWAALNIAMFALIVGAKEKENQENNEKESVIL